MERFVECCMIVISQNKLSVLFGYLVLISCFKGY